MTKLSNVIGAVCRLATALAVSISFVCNARAEDYPTRPITIVVPFAAGGPTDILSRIVAQAIGPTLGQQVVVEDVTGAGGTIGATKVARAAPDGYTMVMGNLGTHAASVGITANWPTTRARTSSRLFWLPRRRWSWWRQRRCR